jgi:hypothetical protein
LKGIEFGHGDMALLEEWDETTKTNQRRKNDGLRIHEGIADQL